LGDFFEGINSDHRFESEKVKRMSEQAPGKRTTPPIGYLHFVIALCVGMMIGTVGLFVLEYFEIINFAKNWP
jgi:capsular polysaccharide biosynthesis protein